MLFPGLGAFSPKNRTTKQRMADSFGLDRGETMPGSFSVALFLQPKLSLLCSFQKRPLPFCHRLWITLHAQDSRPRSTRQQPSPSMRAEQVWSGEAPPVWTVGPSHAHSYLSSLLMQWKRLQKSSYQKNMKPVERAAFSRLGDRPLKRPWVPSSCSTCLVRSRRPL